MSRPGLPLQVLSGLPVSAAKQGGTTGIGPRPFSGTGLLSCISKEDE